MTPPDNVSEPPNRGAAAGPQIEEHQFALGEEGFVGEYVGFWKRLAATLIDLLIFGLVTFPVLYAVYGERIFESDRAVLGHVDFVLSYVAPAVATIAFWRYARATPGKMAISAVIVDARTGGPVPLRRLIGRYFAYFVSALPLGFGFLWIAFDRRKQGWHDKLANTVVIYEPV